MIQIRIRTEYEQVAEAIAHLAPWVHDDVLTLAHERSVPPATEVDFRIALEDDTRVLEGRGFVRGSDDLGADAPPQGRFQVLIEQLEFDERNRSMWDRILRAARSPSSPPGTGSVIPSRPITAAPPPALPELRTGASIPVQPSKEGETRIMRSEELLRVSSTDASMITAVGGDPAPVAEGFSLPVPPDVLGRAEALSMPGGSKGPLDVLRLALRLGLAALEEQARATE
ncbi:MAG: hypothetical protein U0230_04715 [Polyangiales bacterium]